MSGSVPIWLGLLAAAVVATALLVGAATGRLTLQSGEPVGPDRAPVPLPPDPTADDVDLVRFAVDVPGYRRDQVDATLVRLQDTLRAREARIAELEAALAQADGADTGESFAPRG